MKNRTMLALTMTFLSVALMMANLPQTQTRVTYAATNCGAPLFSFETGTDNWTVSEGTASLAQGTTGATTGTSALQVTLTATTKIVFGAENGEGWDFSQPTTLSLDVTKTGQPTKMTLALKTGDGWIWYESIFYNLTDGKNSLNIDLKSSDWKSAASGWNNTAVISDVNKVKGIYILFHDVMTNGVASVDNVRTCQQEATATPTATPSPTTQANEANCTAPYFSFESDVQGWKGSGYGDSADTSFLRTTMFATSGKYGAQLEYDITDTKSKATYIVESDAGWDYTPFKTFRFDMKGGPTNPPMQVALALSTGGWVWTESVVKDLPSNGVAEFDLTTSDWKTAASNWENKVKIENLNIVHRIAILVFPKDKGPGGAFLDNVRLCAASPDQLPPTNTPVPPTPTATPSPTATASPTPPANPTPAKASDFVSADGKMFMLNNQPFYYAGTNNYYVMYAKPQEVANAFDDAKFMGVNVVRMWGFMDVDNITTTEKGVYFQYWDDNKKAVAYNDGDNGLKYLDFAIYSASQRGVKLIIPFVNNWGDFGGVAQYRKWYEKMTGQKSEFHYEFYLKPEMKQMYKNYVSHLLNRVNSYSHVAYKDDPTIFAWELGNELRCRVDLVVNPTLCNPDVTTAWADEMAKHIKSIDKNHMVAMGDEGWLDLPSVPHGTGDTVKEYYPYNGFDGIDTEKLLMLDSIDFGTAHLYPDHWGQTAEWGAKWINEHADLMDKHNKPFILEEYGWKNKENRWAIYKLWTDTILQRKLSGDNFWMLGGLMSDGKYYPDYDSFTMNKEDKWSALLTAHARDMALLNTTAATGGSCSVNFLPAIMKQ